MAALPGRIEPGDFIAIAENPGDDPLDSVWVVGAVHGERYLSLLNSEWRQRDMSVLELLSLKQDQCCWLGKGEPELFNLDWEGYQVIRDESGSGWVVCHSSRAIARIEQGEPCQVLIKGSLVYEGSFDQCCAFLFAGEPALAIEPPSSPPASELSMPRPW